MDDRNRPSPPETISPQSRAIAIKREPESDARPRVVAKGEGALAEQILAIAFERDIKVRTDADLAEILSAVEVESEIPLEALAFDGMMVHSAMANRTSTRRRRGYAIRFAVEGATYEPRDSVTEWLHDPAMRAGQPFRSETFPVIYSAA